MRPWIHVVVMLMVFALSAVAQDQKPVERRFGLAKPIRISAEAEVYGAELKALPMVDLKEVVAKPAVWKGRTVQLRGVIDAVCAKKGCWMTLSSEEQRVRVGFREYGFFVPFDVAGRQVAVEGNIDVRVESEAERRHYAQDAGKSAEEIAAIKGDRTVISFIADSVQIGKLPAAPAAAKAELGTGEKLTPGGAVCPEVKGMEKAGQQEKKADCAGCAQKATGCAGCQKGTAGGANPAETGKKPADCKDCEKKAEPAKPADGVKKTADCKDCEKKAEPAKPADGVKKTADCKDCESKTEPAKKAGCEGCDMKPVAPAGGK